VMGLDGRFHQKENEARYQETSSFHPSMLPPLQFGDGILILEIPIKVDIK